MKNIIIVDIDTEREQPVQIGKPHGGDIPKNEKEAEDMVLRDMACLCEAINVLIHAADQSGYKPSHESLKDCIQQLELGFADASVTADITIPSEEEDKPE